MPATEAVPEKVQEAIDTICREVGVVPIEVRLRGQRDQLILEIAIDSVEGVSHEDCTAVSRSLDDLLEADPFWARLRTVEVSSPGADRPVAHLWQLRKHTGRNVRVVRTDGSALEGTLVDAADDALTLQPPGTKKQPVAPVTIGRDEITSAMVKLKF